MHQRTYSVYTDEICRSFSLIKKTASVCKVPTINKLNVGSARFLVADGFWVRAFQMATNFGLNWIGNEISAVKGKPTNRSSHSARNLLNGFYIIKRSLLKGKCVLSVKALPVDLPEVTENFAAWYLAKKLRALKNISLRNYFHSARFPLP